MERIELGDGAYLLLDRAWCTEPLAPQLTREVPWEARAIRLFGREVMQPRLVAWVGDPDAVYTYSGVRHQPLPWTATLTALRASLRTVCAEPFNAVLCNLYRDGQDSMGLHRDAEPELGPDPVVASVSFGAPRKFTLRADRGAGKLELMLGEGSLLLMMGTTQRHWRHGVPKVRGAVGPRINLTFRRIIPR